MAGEVGDAGWGGVEDVVGVAAGEEFCVGVEFHGDTVAWGFGAEGDFYRCGFAFARAFGRAGWSRACLAAERVAFRGGRLGMADGGGKGEMGGSSLRSE